VTGNSVSITESVRDVLKHAASQKRCVIEFEVVDGQLIAKDITEHVEVLEKKIDN